jgi:FkbM family methyltransferase
MFKTGLLRHYLKSTPVGKWARSNPLAQRAYVALSRAGWVTSDIRKASLVPLLGRKDPVIVEIGASDGTDSAALLSHFPDARMFLFEPDPRQIADLRARFEGLQNVTVIEAAICDGDGSSPFWLSAGQNSHSRYIGSSSIKEPANASRFVPEVKFEEVVKVPTRSLDSWAEETGISSIDLVWADVQGAERELIIGGERTLNRMTRYFYTEYSNEMLYQGQPTLEEILRMLDGFELMGIFGSNALLRNRRLVNA